MGNKWCANKDDDDPSSLLVKRREYDRKRMTKTSKSQYRRLMIQRLQAAMRIHLLKKVRNKAQAKKAISAVGWITIKDIEDNEELDKVSTPTGSIFQLITNNKVKRTLKKFPKVIFKKGATKEWEYRPMVLVEDETAHYEGQWIRYKDKRDGKGVMVYNDSSMYQGDWLNDKPHGFGQFIDVDGCYYDGQWSKGTMHGYGIEVFVNGNWYKGDKLNGLNDGKGNYSWDNGNEYAGDFKKGKIEGTGTYTWSNGNKYDGEWKNGKMEGKGTFSDKDGSVYIGEYKMDKKEGIGELTWKNGTKYEGEWFNDRQHGKGFLTDLNGEKIKTKFEHGKLIGKKANKKGSLPPEIRENISISTGATNN